MVVDKLEQLKPVLFLHLLPCHSVTYRVCSLSPQQNLLKQLHFICSFILYQLLIYILIIRAKFGTW